MKQVCKIFLILLTNRFFKEFIFLLFVCCRESVVYVFPSNVIITISQDHFEYSPCIVTCDLILTRKSDIMFRHLQQHHYDIWKCLEIIFSIFRFLCNKIQILKMLRGKQPFMPDCLIIYTFYHETRRSVVYGIYHLIVIVIKRTKASY